MFYKAVKLECIGSGVRSLGRSQCNHGGIAGIMGEFFFSTSVWKGLSDEDGLLCINVLSALPSMSFTL